MDEYEDRLSVMDAIGTMYYAGGTTATAEGLTSMRDEVFDGDGVRRGNHSGC